MKAPRIARLPLSTARLVLRPSGHEDAGQALAILSDWQVSRMLRMANFPPEKEEVSAWFTWHKHEWAEGAAYRFTILLEGRMIGLADIDNIVGGEGVLGYWLERTAWGHGYASGLARSCVSRSRRSACRKSGQPMRSTPLRPRACCKKLGFLPTAVVRHFSYSRREDIIQQRYELTG